MAHEKIITEIKARFCECSICMYEYNEREFTPRILPCRHTYCSQCLETLCRNYRLKCPQCNVLHGVKENDISAFRKDNTIRDLVCFLSAQEKRVSCCNCSCDDVIYCCRPCKTFLCKTCKNIHIIAASKHHIIPVNTELSVLHGDQSPAFICYEENHERNELKYFCYSTKCRKVLCANCVAAFHSNHDTRCLFEIYEERKKVLQSKLELLKPRVDSTKERINEINRKLENLRDNTEFALVLNIDKTERKRRVRELEAERAALRNFSNNANECCAIVEEILQEDIPTFLEAEKTLAAKMQTFIEIQLGIRKRITPLQIPHNDIKNKMNLQEHVQRNTNVFNRKLDVNHGIVERIFKTIFSVIWWTIKSFIIILFKPVDKTAPNSPMINRIIQIAALIFLYGLVGYLAYHAADPMYTFFGYENGSDIMFMDSNKNTTSCMTEDRLSISSVPFDNISQICTSNKMFYKHSGVFANVSVRNNKRMDIDLNVIIRKLNKNSSFEGVIFEFGFSPNITHSKYIYNSNTNDVWGWSLIKTQKQFYFWTKYSSFKEELIQLDLENRGHSVRKFRVSILPGKNTVSLRDRSSSSEIDKITFPTSASLTWPVFSVFYTPELFLKLKLLKKNSIAFNKESADIGLYLSRDNYTVSNQWFKKSWPIPQTPVDQFHYTSLLNCSHYCLYMMEVSFDRSLVKSKLFEVGLVSQAGNISTHLPMLEYVPCTGYFWYCLFRNCLKGQAINAIGNRPLLITIQLDMVNNIAKLYVIGSGKISTVLYETKLNHSMYFRSFSSDNIIISLRNKNNYLLYHYVYDTFMQSV